MKKSIVSKRSALLAVLVLALGAAVYLNLHLSREEVGQTTPEVPGGSAMGQAVYVNGDSSAVTQDEEDYFVKARKDRKTAREEAVAALKKIIDDPRSDKNAVADATTKSATIAKHIETESNIETLVKAKGIADCVAVIGEEAVSIIVKTDGLLASDTMQIQEIAQQNTEFSLENIKIIEVK